MFPWVSHPPTPAGSFSKQDPGMGRESPGVGPAWPPSSQQSYPTRSQVHPGTGTHCQLSLTRSSGWWRGWRFKSRLCPHRALETQRPLCEMRLFSKGNMNIQCNQCAKCLECGSRDQVTLLPELSLPTQQRKARAFKATYVRTFKSYEINWKVLTVEIK